MRKQLLYARRLFGDIGPLNKDPVTNLPGRILAPAVSIDGVYQEYDEQSETAHFTIGSRMVVDERTYHYSRATHAIGANGTFYLSVITDQYLAVSEQLTIAPASLVDTSSLVVGNAAGQFQGGDVDADELVGGWLEIWPAAHPNYIIWRRITSNTAQVAGAPASITFTVDRPLNFAVAVGSLVGIHPSIYRAVQSSFDAGLGFYQVAVGLPPIPVTIDYYFWLQTWGPCWIGASLLEWPLGHAANFVDLYFSTNEGGSRSSLQPAAACGGAIATAESPQRIGYALGAGNYGPGSMMLQLAP